MKHLPTVSEIVQYFERQNISFSVEPVILAELIYGGAIDSRNWRQEVPGFVDRFRTQILVGAMA